MTTPRPSPHDPLLMNALAQAVRAQFVAMDLAKRHAEFTRQQGTASNDRRPPNLAAIRWLARLIGL